MKKNPNINVPNALSLSRIIGTPFLFWAYKTGNYWLFGGLYLIVGSTDMFDGWYARKFNQKTKLGAQIDSWADIVFYFSTIYFYIIIGKPLILTYKVWVGIGLAFYAIYLIYPVIRYKKAKLMHTRLVRMAAVFTFIAMIWAVFAALFSKLVIIAAVFLLLTIAVSIAGFIECIIIFHRYPDEVVNESVVSLKQLKQSLPPL